MGKVTEHEMVAKIKELHKESGKVPTIREFTDHFSRRQISKFGYNNLVKMAGFEPNATHEKCPEIIVYTWKAKILFLDIETSAIVAQVWGLWNQNIGLNQIIQDWSVLSYAAKFYEDDKIYYLDQRFAQDKNDDRQLIEGIHDLINQSDFIVAHNVDFDWGKLNSKFIKYSLPPVHPRQICTLKMARKLMKKGITSKKLEFLAKWLNVTPKEKHEKFHGMELWNECLNGNMDAWDELEKYNKGDIITLEEVFWKLARYDDKINFNIYQHKNTCICGSTDFIRDGYKVTNGSKKQRYRCSQCSKVYSAKVEEVPINIRHSLFN